MVTKMFEQFKLHYDLSVFQFDLNPKGAHSRDPQKVQV
jgi:hypothetical protein